MFAVYHLILISSISLQEQWFSMPFCWKSGLSNSGWPWQCWGEVTEDYRGPQVTLLQILLFWNHCSERSVLPSCLLTHWIRFMGAAVDMVALICGMFAKCCWSNSPHEVCNSSNIHTFFFLRKLSSIIVFYSLDRFMIFTLKSYRFIKNLYSNHSRLYLTSEISQSVTLNLN